MNQLDSSNIEKSDFKQLERKLQIKAYRIWGAGWEDKLTGILMGDSSAAGLQEKQEQQEYHNSGHALWFLLMAAYGVVENQQAKLGADKTNRILAHLTCLREFIPEEKARLRAITKELCEAILAEFPDSRMKWLHFLDEHWFLIQSFAEYYKRENERRHEASGEQYNKGYDQFSEALYQKIHDVHLSRHYFRLWWWGKKIGRLTRGFKHQVRKLSEAFRSVMIRKGANCENT